MKRNNRVIGSIAAFFTLFLLAFHSESESVSSGHYYIHLPNVALPIPERFVLILSRAEIQDGTNLSIAFVDRLTAQDRNGSLTIPTEIIVTRHVNDEAAKTAIRSIGKLGVASLKSTENVDFYTVFVYGIRNERRREPEVESCLSIVAIEDYTITTTGGSCGLLSSLLEGSVGH